jgi:hypothetical protein
MTMSDVAVVSRDRSYVDWAAILAGAALTTAIALVLLAFGSALGLSVTSPYEGEGFSPIAFAIAAGLWLLWVHLLSFYVGGYVAARLRPRVNDATEHEVDVRDGLHGLLVWAVGVILAAFIAFVGMGGATAAARGAETAGDAAASVGQVLEEQVAQGAAEERARDPEARTATEQQRRAEVTRKLTVISGFITAASLLLGAAAAFFGAGLGGNHRDKNTIVELFGFRVARAP